MALSSTIGLALSKKTLEVDSLIVETIFNRGLKLPTSQSYIPTLNNLGAFSQILNQPISSIFNSLFYNTDVPTVLNSTINVCELDFNYMISSFQQLNIITQFSNANNSTLIHLSNYYSSVILNQYSSIANNSTLSYNYYSSISTNINNITSSVQYFSTSLYSTNFSPYATSLIRSANLYYSTGGTRDIGPGLSSMYTISLLSNDLIKITYPSILSNTSTAWVTSNTSLNIYRDSLLTTINSLGSYIDNGTSISTLYYKTYSTLYNQIVSTSYVVNNVSNAYSNINRYINNYIIPTNGPFISSANISIQYTISTNNSFLLQTISTNISPIPVNQFSNTFSSQLISINTILNTNTSMESLFTISTYLSTNIIPVANTLSLSTIYSLYKAVSSFGNSIISNYMFTSFDSLNNYNNSLLNLSNNDYINTSTLLNSINSYITAPSISTIYNTLSTNIQLFYDTLEATNTIPKISLLYLTGSTIISTIVSQNNTINNTFDISDI